MPGGGYTEADGQAAEVHVTVGPDGSLSVAAPQLENAGIHAGDQVIVAASTGGNSAQCWAPTTGGSTSKLRTSVGSEPRWPLASVRT